MAMNQYNWAPYNNMPTTWQPNTQYPPPSNVQGYVQDRSYRPLQPINNVLRAMGPESAKAYPMGPNSNVVLFDAQEPTFYWVSTDDSAFKSMRIFDFKEREQASEVLPVAEAMDTSGFATKDDIDAIRAELANISEALKGLV